MEIGPFEAVVTRSGLSFPAVIQLNKDQIVIQRKSPHGNLNPWFEIASVDVTESAVTNQELFLQTSTEPFSIRFTGGQLSRFEQLCKRFTPPEQFVSDEPVSAPARQATPAADQVIAKSKFFKVILVLSVAYFAFIVFALYPKASIETKGEAVTALEAHCDLKGCNEPAACIRYSQNSRTGEQFHKYYVCRGHCSSAGEWAWQFSVDHNKRKQQWEGIFTEPDWNSALLDPESASLVIAPLVLVTLPMLIYILWRTDRERAKAKMRKP